MTNDQNKQPEGPDPKAAARDPKPGAEDRPGFDLGGAADKSSTAGSTVMPETGPKGSPAQGTTAAGHASGLTDPSGSNSSGEHKGGGPRLHARPTIPQLHMLRLLAQSATANVT